MRNRTFRPWLASLLIAAAAYGQALTFSYEGLGDYFSHVTTDNAGNIYTTGTVTTATSGRQVLVASYTSAGALRWTRVVDPGALDGYGTNIHFKNNQIFASYLTRPAGMVGYGTLRMTTQNGVILNDSYLEAPGGTFNPNAVMAANGTIYETAYETVASPFPSNTSPLLYSYTPGVGGQFTPLAGDPTRSLQSKFVYPLPNGIYVAGNVYANPAYTYVAKYDPTTLALVWIQYLNGPGTRLPIGIRADVAGNIFVGGYIDNGGTAKNDFFLTKFSPAGALLAESFVDYGPNSHEIPNCMGMIGGTTPVLAGYTISATGVNKLYGAVFQNNLTVSYTFTDSTLGIAQSMSCDANAAYILTDGQPGNREYSVIKAGATGIFWTTNTHFRGYQRDIQVSNGMVFLAGSGNVSTDAQLTRLDPANGAIIW